MRAIILSNMHGGYGGPEFYCAQCYSRLIRNHLELYHDTTKGAIFPKPVKCEFAGKRFDMPTVELKEAAE